MKNAGHQVVVSDVTTESLRQWVDSLGVEITTSNVEAAKGADVVVLAVPFGAVEEIAAGISDQVADALHHPP